MKKLQSIGTTELVSFPDGGVQDVSAKIDTGADSSAVWATHITEQNGQLSYTLFGKSSPYYTGQPFVTKDYKVVSIKNSFGQAEFRYKVKLKLVLAGRTIQATFTLANRAHNHYPILIGRQTLRGKFLVDVAKKPANKARDVLLICSSRMDYNQNFIKNLESHNKKLKVTLSTYEDMCFTISESGNHVTLRDTGRDLASYSLVYFKTSTQYKGLAAAAANYLQKRSVPFLNSILQYFSGTSKIYQYAILSDHDVPIPHSIFMLPSRLERSYPYLEQELGLPFILKDIHGKKGENNFLITNSESFKKACQQAAKQQVLCIAQAFVDNDGDYRVLVFGTRISLVIRRTRTSQATHLNNTSQGAEATLVKPTSLPIKVQTASVAAARLLGRQVAGVDFVQDKLSGLWYCLEVNDGPQLATGAFIEEKHAAFAAYLERKLSK
jgi:glutathione synthase/RimK-type ligase-like ATP-grasp enzyme